MLLFVILFCFYVHLLSRLRMKGAVVTIAGITNLRFDNATVGIKTNILTRFHALHQRDGLVIDEDHSISADRKTHE
jgi:hypothetical protein